MRIVFFGTPGFAVPSLEVLARAGHTIAAVVTQPDKPRGRGQHVRPSDVKVAGLRLPAPVLEPARLKDPGLARELEDLESDLGVVAAYGRILPATLLEIPRLGMINVHASLLPRWRGAAPVQRAILNGDESTGVTIMRVVPELDAGPILAQTSTPISHDETSATLEHRLATLGAALLEKTVTALAVGPIEEMPQDQRLVTYAARLEKAESVLDWARPALAVHNQIRGLQPWPVAASKLQGKRILLRASVPLPDERHGVSAGTVVRVENDAIVVAAAPGAVRLTMVQIEGRQAVTAAAFLNGHHVEAGDRFET